MLSSTRFAVAIHAMSVLARHAGRGPVCSALMAQSVSTNPVVIRRLMSDLEAAGLITSSAGRSGGFALTRPARDVSLADIYRAVEDECVFRMHRTDPSSNCPIGAQIAEVIREPLCAAAKALATSLAGVSLADIADKICVERGNEPALTASAP